MPEPGIEPPFNSAWSVLNEQARSPWKRGQQMTPNRADEPPIDSGEGYRHRTEPPVDLVADVSASLERVAALQAEAKAKAAHQLRRQVLAIQERVAALRTEGVREMRARGDSLKEVGDALGVSISRAKQIQEGSG